MTSAEALEHAMSLFNAQQWDELVEFAGTWLETHPEDPEIWKLYGAALSATHHDREASRAFLCALKLDPKDGYSAVNYITSCLASQENATAIEAVQAYFSQLTHELKAALAEQFQHAVGQGLLREEEVPEKLRLLFSGEMPTRPFRSPEDAGRALLKAAAAGELGEVERAWEDGADLDIRDREGWQAIHLAIQNDHLRVADWLLQYGADPAGKGAKGVTPLELARQSPDARWMRLLEGYFPKVQSLAAGPFATYATLINEIYETLTGMPARAVRNPEADDFEDLQVPGVAFGIARAEVATELVPTLTEIFGLKSWHDRPEDFAQLTRDTSGRVCLLTLEWIELSDAPLMGSLDEVDRQFLARYSRNIDAVARVRLVTPRRLERLLGALYYEDREEPVALGHLTPEAVDELFGPNLEFRGWTRVKSVLSSKVE
ncbi:MAG: ankyrin repeat domain-containing protein [Bdellovibrionaceae bacterium]|nr:ankyrin repeat domain-containing protein [Pseudobdellovibrionaceae bacterium]